MAILTLDTWHLIDHQREVLAERPGPAHDFASRHADDHFAVPSVAWGEFLVGFPSGDDEIPARIFRELKKQGALIGANDLWIAALAVSAKLSLVSRNGADFRRIPGLELLVY